MCEIDAYGGPNASDLVELIRGMRDLGYAYSLFQKDNCLSGLAIFYKIDKLTLLETGKKDLAPEEGQIFMYCLFQVVDTGFEFVFSEAHLKAKTARY